MYSDNSNEAVIFKQIEIMKLTILSQNISKDELKLTFPDLNNASVVVHSGNHINSKNNWSGVAPHGNSKKVKESVLNENGIEITLIHRPKVNEEKYPNQMKYSVVVSGNMWAGKSACYYKTTGDMRISEDAYNELSKIYN